jgi:hypothetical protein
VLLFLLPWPRLNLLIRSILEDRWDAESWPTEGELGRALELRRQLRPRCLLELSRRTLSIALAATMLAIAEQAPASAQPAQQRLGPSYLYPPRQRRAS